MKSQKLFKLMVPVGFLFLAACSPSSKSTQGVGLTQSSSIIGGEPVVADDQIARSTVALIGVVIDEKNQESQFICTGTMVRPNVILTAAHCVPTVPKGGRGGLLAVFARDLSAATENDVRAVVGVVIHPLYGQVGAQGEDAHDVALLKIRDKMPDGYELGKLLTDDSLLQQGSKVTLAGFGLIETDGVNTKSDDKLRKVDVEVVERFGATEVILDQTQGKGACHGDSGGPAFLEVMGVQYVWGVTSRGLGKNGVDDCSLISVYGRIGAHTAFIEQGLKRLSGSPEAIAQK